MATIPQVRGVLLEEAVLSLLHVSGFDVVDAAAPDPTLQTGPSGLEVKGRGRAIPPRSAALDLKEQQLSEIQAMYSGADWTSHVIFRLDEGWLESVRAAIRQRHGRDQAL